MEDQIELGPQCHERYFCGTHYAQLAALGVPAAGLSDLQGHYRVDQQLPVHLIEFTLGGHGLGRADGWSGRLDAATMFCVPAGTRFRLETDAGSAWTTAWLHLEPRRWPRFVDQPEVRDGVDAKSLATLLGLLDDERDREDEIAAALKRTLSEAFGLWLRRVLGSDAGAPAARQRAALQAVFDRVRAHPSEDWRADRLAALAGCSRSQLHRRCVEVFGHGPAAQVTHLRMREAEYWLTATSAPLKVVADRLGYASPYHFSTAFKRFAGIAPALYRAGGRPGSVPMKALTTASSC